MSDAHALTTRVPLVVLGAGGHGRVVAEVAIAQGLEVAGFLDDRATPGASVLGLPLLGGRDWLEGRPHGVLLGIGDNVARAAAGRALAARLATAQHPRATVSPSAVLGPGAVVMAGAVINAGAVVEEGVIVNSAAVVEHDVRLGPYAHVSPNATLAGGASLGTLGHLGAGAIVLPGLCVGARSVVGAGAVVTRSFGEDLLIKGVPGRSAPKSRPHP